MDIKRYLSKKKKFIDEKITEFLSPQDQRPAKLNQAIHYCMLDGGKRIRAILMLEIANLMGKEIENIIKAACGIEMIHTSTLILDDLPSMDDALLRRGKPALHRIHGEAVTILCAYILLMDGIKLIIDNAFQEGLSKDDIYLIWKDLSQGLGKEGVMGGQELDLELSSQKLNAKLIEELHGKKTASLFVTAIDISAVILGAEDKYRQALNKFAKYFGHAFQISDDLLVFKSKPQVSGKLSLKTQLRPNYAILMGKKKAEQKVKFYTEKAIKSLSLFKEKCDNLIAIVEYLKERKA